MPGICLWLQCSRWEPLCSHSELYLLAPVRWSLWAAKAWHLESHRCSVNRSCPCCYCSGAGSSEAEAYLSHVWAPMEAGPATETFRAVTRSDLKAGCGFPWGWVGGLMLWPQVSRDSAGLVSGAPRAKVSMQPPNCDPPTCSHG